MTILMCYILYGVYQYHSNEQLTCDIRDPTIMKTCVFFRITAEWFEICIQLWFNLDVVEIWYLSRQIK